MSPFNPDHSPSRNVNHSNPTKITHTHQLEIGENAFWVVVWLILAASILALTFMIANYNANKEELIVKSADPIASACATGLSGSTTNQCQALMIRRN